MTWTAVPLPDGSYADANRSFTQQDLCNYLPVFAEAQGTRSRMKLVCPPGLREYASVGNGPIRGMHDAEGRWVVVSDETAYWLKSSTEVETLGTVPGRGQVWIVHNQITNGCEVMISTGPDAWIWNTVTGDFTKITDDAFRGAVSPDYIASQFLAIEAQRRFFANSGIAAGLEWDSIERYESESSPDRLQCLVVSHSQVLVLNERTAEFFEATTNPTDIENHIYFTRIQGSALEVGGASTRCASRLDNSVFFVGSDGSGYRLNGYTPQRITPFAIEHDWAQCDLSKCFTFTWEDRGHKVWYVTFPDGHTWGYDCSSGKWHRRESKGIDRWRVNNLLKFHGSWYAGSYNSGLIYKLDWEYMREGADELASTFTTGVLHDEGNLVTLNGLRIEFDTSRSGSVDYSESITPIDLGEVTDGLYPTNSGSGVYSFWRVNSEDFTKTDGPAAGGASYPVINAEGTRLYFGRLGTAVGYVTLSTDTPTYFSSTTYGPLAVDPSETYCYYGAALSSLIRRVRISDGVEVSTHAFPMGGAPLCINNAGTKIFGATYSNGDELMAKFDIATLTTTEYTVADRENGRGICLSYDESEAYITCINHASTTPYVVVLSTADGSKIREWELPDTGGIIAVSPSGIVAVAHYSAVSGTIWIYSPTGILMHTITNSYSDISCGLKYNSTGTRLYHVALNGLRCFDAANNYGILGSCALPDNAADLAIYPPYPMPDA